MNNTSNGLVVLLVALSAASLAAVAAEDAAKGPHGFKACYRSSIPPGMTGAPELTVDVIVDSPTAQRASGTGTVNWASVGPAFQKIVAPIEGPWYWMCTMQSCDIGFNFSSAPGARALKGRLIAPNWGYPGKFYYTFDGGPGEVTQDAKVCP